jgi:membrane protease YdiL (CAAX protease family)
MIFGIIVGSTFKGLVAGLIIGLVARKLNSINLGILIGLAVGFLLALPFAMMPAENGQVYFWEIIIPGSLVGLILGFATQKYGKRPVSSAVTASAQSGG